MNLLEALNTPNLKTSFRACQRFKKKNLGVFVSQTNICNPFPVVSHLI